MGHFYFKSIAISTILVLNIHLIQGAFNTTNTTSHINTKHYCPKRLYPINIHGIEFPPYVHVNGSKTHGELVRFEKIATKKCCASMSKNISYKIGNISSSDDIEETIRSDMQFEPMVFFPVFANRDAQFQFGRDFIGLYESPGLVVVKVRKESLTENAVKQLDALFTTWPILVICVLSGVFAGLVIWLLDCRSNKDFSPSFISGAGAGVWWSFVTMSTVGYGDKSPKSLFGRFFAVIWMLIGTILLSMLSAQITAYLAAYEVTESFSVQNKKIAVPLGIQNYLEKELNLGASYSEHSTRVIMEVLATGNASKIDGHDYVILHDLENMHFWSIAQSNQTLPSLDIKMTISHRMYLGVVITNKPHDSDNFFTCWKTSLVDQIALLKLKNRRKYHNQLKQSASSTSRDNTTVQNDIIKYMGMVTGALVALGLLWEFIRRLNTRSTSVSNPA